MDRVRLVAADAALASQLLLIRVVLRGRRGTVQPANLRDAENGLPAPEARGVALGGGKPEASGGKGSFGPAVVDAGEMPVHGVRGRVAAELVADVDEVLHGCDVDVVDGGEIENDGFEGGLVGFDGDRFAAARARVIPGAVLVSVSVDAMGRWGWREGAYAKFWVGVGVGAASFLEDGGDHLVEVVVGVGVVEAFRESVHEDAWVR